MPGPACANRRMEPRAARIRLLIGAAAPSRQLQDQSAQSALLAACSRSGHPPLQYTQAWRALPGRRGHPRNSEVLPRGWRRVRVHTAQAGTCPFGVVRRAYIRVAPSLAAHSGVGTYMMQRGLWARRARYAAACSRADINWVLDYWCSAITACILAAASATARPRRQPIHAPTHGACFSQSRRVKVAYAWGGYLDLRGRPS